MVKKLSLFWVVLVVVGIKGEMEEQDEDVYDFTSCKCLLKKMKNMKFEHEENEDVYELLLLRFEDVNKMKMLMALCYVNVF